MGAPLDPNHVEAIIDASRRGMTVGQIADMIGCSQRTVQRVRERHGLAQQWHPRMTAEQIARAEQLLADGASYNEVGRTLGVNWCSIRRRFPGQGWTREQVDEYLALRHFRKLVQL